MTVAEGGGRRAVARKFQDVYLPALKANYVIWPTVQVLNFRVVPLQFQLVSFLGKYLRNLISVLTSCVATGFYHQHRMDGVFVFDKFL